MPGGMLSCAHALLEFDGRQPGSHFKDLSPPLPAFAPFGGPMLDMAALLHFLAFTGSPRSFAGLRSRCADG